MYFNFLPTNKRKTEAIYFLILIVIALPFIYWILSTGDIGAYQPLVYGMIILLLGKGVYRTYYYYRLPKKPYIFIDKNVLSISQGMLLPRKQVLLDQTVKIKQYNEILIIELKNHEEVQIYTNFISEEDTSKLKSYLTKIKTTPITSNP